MLTRKRRRKIETTADEKKEVNFEKAGLKELRKLFVAPDMKKE